MNSVQFTGLSNNTNPPITANNKKQMVKRAVTAAVITGGVAIGGALVYKNRNSKHIQKAVSIVKENVLEPLNKKTLALREGAKDAFQTLKAKIKDLKESAFDIKPDVKDAPAPKAKAPKIKKTKTPKLSGKKIIEAAKDNAGKLRTGAAGLGAGAALGATGIGAVNKVNEISENDSMEKGDKIILTGDGEEFKGYFKRGRAYDENGQPLSGKLTIVTGTGRKLIPNDNNKLVARTIMSKSIMQYEKGILRKATYFEDIDSKTPTWIKAYDENGSVAQIYDKLTYTGEKGKVAPSEISNFTVVDNPNSVKTPIVGTKTIIEEDGSETVKYYKKNVDDEGAVKGAPIYAFSTNTQKLSDGGTLSDFYVADTKGRGADFLTKRINKKPNGITKIVMRTRGLGVANYGKEAINGHDKAVLTLDSYGRAVSYKLIMDSNHDLDGLIRLRGGKILSANDEAHMINLNYSIGDAMRWSPLMHTLPVEKDEFADEFYSLRDYYTKVGIKYHENSDVVKSIALYNTFGDFPDTVTYFDTDGRPVRDMHYTGFSEEGKEVIFSPKYVYAKAAPVLPDDIEEARRSILKNETRAIRAIEKAKKQAKAKQSAQAQEKTGA